MARMLRPSRPMIRPFISSLGSSISRVVVSLACVPASRPIAIERMLRARRSASRFVSSSIWMQDPARLVSRILLDVGDQHLLGLGGGQPRQPLQLLALHLLLPLQLLGLAVEVALAVGEGALATLDVGELQPCSLGVVEGAFLQPCDLLAPAPAGRSTSVGSLRRSAIGSAALRRSVPDRRPTAVVVAPALPVRDLSPAPALHHHDDGKASRPSGPRQAPDDPVLAAARIAS